MATFKQKREEENPFRPAQGEAPPLLAGRGDAQRKLSTRLRGLVKDGTRRAFTICGPRGMGKTALLAWVVQEAQLVAEADRKKVSVIEASAEEMLASEESLLATLVPQKRKRGPTEVGVKAELATVGGASFTHTSVAGDILLAELRGLLIAACLKTPMVLLLDEAHVVHDAQLYRLFLNVAQAVAIKAPFLLALSGTPDLPIALSSTGAGHISRAEALGIGLLEPGEAEKAIRTPLADDGIQIANDALAFAVEEAQRYPYFLQFWGKALWSAAMTDGKQRLTMQDAESAGAEAGKGRLGYYAERYLEVARDQLTGAAAQAVSDAFKDKDSYYAEQLLRFIQQALAAHLPAEEVEDGANEQFKTLQQLGFIWEQPYEDVVRPGIPSLLDYTRDRMLRAQ